jgi:hypothetical protein
MSHLRAGGRRNRRCSLAFVAYLAGRCTTHAICLLWDAHGFDIAEHVLGHIMPLVADKRHIVVCHDISDNRYAPQGSYGGKRLWRGMADFYEKPDTFTYVCLGAAVGVVDQVIPILDFCGRNEIELRSFDWEYDHLRPTEQRAFEKMFQGTRNQLFHMAAFSMNETKSRHFPLECVAIRNAGNGRG